MKPILMIIDCETGGLDPRVHALATLALYCPALDIAMEWAVADYVGEWDPYALKVNGIDPEEHLKTSLAMGRAAIQIEAVLTDAKERTPEGSKLYLGGHNVAFDLGFAKRLYRLADQPLPRLLGPHRTVDTHTMLWDRMARGELPYEATSSQGAFDHFGIERAEPHTALADCVATYELADKLLGL